MEKLKITTPKRKIYFLKRELRKHQDLLLILTGLTAIIFFVIYKILFA